MKSSHKSSLLVITITILLLLSYLPLFMQNVSGQQASSNEGNLYIQSGTTFVINQSTIDPLTGKSGQFGMSGSLYVNSSATLVIDNATLYFRQDVLHHYRMFVNGTLIMNNAVIETSFNAVDPYLPLNISFYKANVITNKAYFLFPGTVYFYESTILLKNTYFNKLNGIPSQLSYDNVTDSSPTPSFYYSTGYLDNVYFENMFHPNPIGNIYFINSTSSNTPKNISAGSAPVTIYPSTISNSYPGETLISGIRINITYISNSNATISLFADGKSVPLLNSTLKSSYGTLNSTSLSSTSISELKLSQLTNTNLYVVIKDTSKSGYFNIEKVNFSLSTNDTFDYYGGNSTFDFNMYSSQIYGMNVFIDSNFLPSKILNGEEPNIKNNILLEDSSDLYVVNLTVSGNVSQSGYLNTSPPFIVDPTSQVNIYRFADINAQNSQGYAIGGLKISAEETWPVDYPNAQAYSNLASSYNENLQSILVSKGFIPSNFNYTIQGKAVIPLLTDIFTNSTYPNTLIMGHYELLMPGGEFDNITFPSFPSLSSSSNNVRFNITYDSPFVYYHLNSIPQFINGNSISVGVTATSYGGSLSGAFVLLNNKTQLTTYPVSLKDNISQNVNIPYTDDLSPGNYTLSLEFVSGQVYASIPPLNFNITSFSNVNLVSSAYLYPKYEIDGNVVSGYPSNLTVIVKNLGNQSSGVVKINVSVTTPNGHSYVYPLMAVINGKSIFNTTLEVPAVNVSTAGPLNVKVSAYTSNGVIPFSTNGENYSSSYTIIPKPNVFVVSTLFNQAYLYGLNATGNVILTSNEPVSNITLNIALNGNIMSIEIPAINGNTEIPVSIPYSYLNLGENNVSIYINNSRQSYISTGTRQNISILVEKNYGFYIQNVQFVLDSNITNYLNGSLFFTVNSYGSFSTTTVPVEVLYNGIQVFQNNEPVNSPVQVQLNLSYSPTMNFEIVANYNFEYPSSYTYYPYMYYNSTVKYPYFYTSYSFPSQIENGSSIKGYFNIGALYNYYSNDTKLFYYLGDNLVANEYLGNLSPGFSNTINFNIPTTSITNIMDGLSVISYDTYVIIKDSETGYFGIKINTGTITFYEKPNYVVSNLTVLVNNHNSTTVYAGESFIARFMVTNNGGTAFSGDIPYEIVGVGNSSNTIFYKGSTNETIYPGTSIIISTPSIPTKSSFKGSLWVYFNYNNTVNTKVEGAINSSIGFEIINPKLIFIITPIYSSISTGSVETLNIKAINSNNSQPWQTNVTILVEKGSKIVESIKGRTNSFGVFVFSFKVVASGNYNVVVAYIGPHGIQQQSYSNVFAVKPKPFEVPSYVYIAVIIVVIIVAFVFVMNYFRNKTAGLVQCSVCGAILPENATKCPRCGTEFEKDRVKCSECGSWIPEDSKYCPNCGALFINKESPDYSGMVKLKAEYESFLSPYRQKAKAILGDKMNELEFQNWWRNNPEYKSFKQWIMEKGMSPEEASVSDKQNQEVDLKIDKKKKGFLKRRNKKE